MLSMLERGRRRPSVVTTAMLIDVYKIPPDAWGLLMAEALEGVGQDSPYKRAKQLRKELRHGQRLQRPAPRPERDWRGHALPARYCLVSTGGCSMR